MDTKDVLGAYCRMMERIKERTDIILNLADNLSGLPAFCAVEVQQLQIRMICETLAKGCLPERRWARPNSRRAMPGQTRYLSGPLPWSRRFSR